MAYLNRKRLCPPHYDCYNDPELKSRTLAKPSPKVHKLDQEESCDLLGFLTTHFDSKSSNKSANNDLQSGQMHFDLQEADDLDKSFLVNEYHSTFEKIDLLEDSTNIGSKTPQIPIQTEVLEESKGQEANQVIQETMDIEPAPNQFSEESDFLKLNESSQSERETQQSVEGFQSNMPSGISFRDLQKSKYMLSFYGNRYQENSGIVFSNRTTASTNFFSPLSFNFCLNATFDLSFLYANPLPLFRKTEEKLELEIQHLLSSKKPTDLHNKTTTTSRKPKENRKAKESHKKWKKQRAEESSSVLLSQKVSLTDTDRLTTQTTTKYKPLTPLLVNIPSIENNSELEYNRITMTFDMENPLFPVNKSLALENTSKKSKKPTKKKQEVPVPVPEIEPQGNINECSSEDSSSKSGLRPEKNYLKLFPTGMMNLVKEGRTGLFLNRWNEAQKIDKDSIIKGLKQLFKVKKRYDVFKSAVFEEQLDLEQNITAETSPKLVLRIAKVKLAEEFVIKENYEYWARYIWNPFKKGEKISDIVKEQKIQILLDKRITLCEKFLSCFKNVPPGSIR